MSTSIWYKTHVLPDEGKPNLIGDGLGATIKVTPESTPSSVSVIDHTLTPGVLAAPLHRHLYEDEVTYVVSGQLTMMQGDEVVTLGPGSYVVKPRGVFHTFWNAGTETLHSLEIIVPGNFANYFAELAPFVPADAPPNLAGVMAVAARYGLEFDMDSLPELMQKYGVRLSGPPMDRMEP
jgi:mannose-6-phosphate isomerase-like protein (cupin superfamily)